MFVTNWISTTKIQKISEITNFFRHYFLSRTEVIFIFRRQKVARLGAILCPSKTISEMSPFAFEIYRMAHKTYRLSFRSLVRKIKIIAIVA